MGLLLGAYQTSAKKRTQSPEGRESYPNPRATSDPVSYLLQRIVFYPQAAVGSGADFIEGFVYGFVNAPALSAQVQQLKDRLAEARSNEEKLQRLESEVIRLRELSLLPKNTERKQVSADIVGFYPIERRVALNVGRRDGVRPGDPVIAPAGLIGQVVEATPTSSYVNLLTHPDFGVGARVTRNLSQEAGIAQGQDSERMLLNVYSETADVKAGDELVTSGLSQIYPEGIPIGRITKLWVNKNLGVRQGEVQPAANLAKIRHVVVLAK